MILKIPHEVTYAGFFVFKKVFKNELAYAVIARRSSDVAISNTGCCVRSIRDCHAALTMANMKM